MPRVTSGNMWSAEVELEIERLALNVQYVEHGRGSAKKRCLVSTDWLDADGETILFDVGKRLKGWLKEQVATMKPSWRDKIQYGIVCKSLPKPGYTPIAKIKNIGPSKNWANFQHKEEYNLGNLPEPNVEVIQTEDGRSVFSLHYVLNRAIIVKAAIYCFAQGINSESVKEWLETLGQIKGLGDMHSSASSYGTFTVKSFKVTQEKEIPF